MNGKDKIQFIFIMQHWPVSTRLGCRLPGELVVMLFHILGKKGFACFDIGDASKMLCLSEYNAAGRP